MEAGEPTTSGHAPPSVNAPPAPKKTLSDPEGWVERYGDYLFRFALSRLRDPSRAEDMVQETFLAALKGSASFAGRADEKSWLAGILKNKIIDHYRRPGRETSFTDLEFYKQEEHDSFRRDGWFIGEWVGKLGPVQWSANPGAALDNAAFWKAFHECAGKMPRNISTVFCLREIDGVESKKICTLLNISENNLWVMLHRARMALRRCLEKIGSARKLEAFSHEVVAIVKEKAGSVGLGAHTELRASSSYCLAVPGSTAFAGGPRQNAIALSHLRLVPTLLQTAQIPASCGAALF
jgi:RNA polymerase sigma-70 factor (ECF subfamily)